jgi:hypothetical protein
MLISILSQHELFGFNFFSSVLLLTDANKKFLFYVIVSILNFEQTHTPFFNDLPLFCILIKHSSAKH